MNSAPGPAITEIRKKFLSGMIDCGLLAPDKDGVASIADSSSTSSRLIAATLLSKIGSEIAGDRRAGQTSGRQLEDFVRTFLEDVFPKLAVVRCGKFHVAAGKDISKYDQYSHLVEVERAVKRDPELRIALGRDYIIKPDVVIYRSPVDDDEINASGWLVDDEHARLTPLRSANSSLPTLHASISCKWTIRSDRVQNARSEALNLIRNRKGKLPHIAVVTAEPMASRLASIALGTGDIDCVYHIALPELRDAIHEVGSEEARELIDVMIEGRRLRDIADLPFDLAT